MKIRILFLAFLVSAFAQGQFSIATGSTNYTENFDSLTSGTWTDGTTLSGWYAKTTATASITTYGANTGTTTTAGFYAFGVAGTNPLSDRALGYAPTNAYTGPAGTGKGYMGWRLKNNTGNTITSITVTWTGEQWRKDNTVNHSLSLFYQTGTTVTDLSAGTWTSAVSTFTSPIVGATAAALDGNASANRTASISATITLTLNAGEEIMLRWEDLNDSGNDHFLAIDDVTVNATTSATVACVTPNVPGGISFGATTNTSIAGTFVASPSATADNYLVVCSTSPTLSVGPTNGTSYAIGASLGGGTVVDNDTNLSFSATSLTAGTKYYFFIYAFDSGCTGGPQYSTNSSSGNNITIPYVPTSFTKGCSTATTQVLSWSAPASGGYDGYLLVVRQGAVPNAVTTIVASSQTFNSNYSLAPTYNASTSRVLYVGTGTSVTVTGLTAGLSYTFALYAYMNNGATSLYSGSTTITQTTALSNVTSAAASAGNTTGTITWLNPSTGCYNDILAVVTTTSGITFAPSGTSYTANTVYAAPNQVVLFANATSVNITGLTNGVTYYVELFVRNGTEWSSGVEVSFTPTQATQFKPGELIFVGYDGQYTGSGAEDEYLVATMVDILPGTQFSIVNSRFEAGAAANVRTNKWGGGGDAAEEPPYTAVITYNGASTIPAGSVLAIMTNGTSSWFGQIDVITGTTTTTRTSEFSGSLGYGITYTPNISTGGSDQMYLIQGAFVSDGSSTPGVAHYTLSGTLLHGLTNRAAWVPLSSACNGSAAGGNTRESRLPADLLCFNVESISASAVSGFYQNDKQHGLATKRQIINAVANVASNWTLGSGRYTKDPTSSLITRAAKTFTIGPSTAIPGQWIGDVSGDSTNWFNCGNWEGLKVPDSSYDVEINSAALANANISATANYSDNYMDLATCKSLSISSATRSLQIEASINNILEVHGDLLIDNTALATGALDMDDSNASNADGVIKLYGDWTNKRGNAAFSEGNGTVQFVGTIDQHISSVAIEGTETFYNVVLDNNFDTAVSNDLIASGDLTIKSSKSVSIDSGGYIKAYKKLDHNGVLTIEDDGQFIQVDETDTNVGTYDATTFKVKRNATVNKDDYVYWSSPTAAFPMTNIPSNGARYYWNTTYANTNGTQGNWNLAAGDMTKGQGYAIGVPNASPIRPAAATNSLVTFTGRPHNGQFTFTITRGNYNGADYDADLVNATNVLTTKYDDNWSLVGNPYPSAIDALEFLNQNSTILMGSIWIWKHGQSPTSTTNPFYTNFSYNYLSSDYLEFNSMGSSDPSFNGKIASGQGFMVNMLHTAATPGTITFNNNMRTVDATYATYDNTTFFRSNSVHTNLGSPEERNRIWLDIINNASGQAETTLVGYSTNSTIERDHFYDCVYVPRGNVSLFSRIANETDAFIIQGRPLPFDSNDRVPMGMRVVAAGTHTIAIRKVDGFFADTVDIYLEDTYLNVIHNLKQGPYSFNSAVGLFNDRFILRYTDQALENQHFESVAKSVVVVGNQGVMTIKSYMETIKEVTVYDVLGRQLFEAKNIGSHDFTASGITTSQQALIVKIKLADGTIVDRKIIL